MKLGNLVLASMCGMVGLVAGRLSVETKVAAAAPAPRFVIPAPVVVREVAGNPDTVAPVDDIQPESDNDNDGRDLANILADAKAQANALAHTHEAIHGHITDPHGEGIAGVTVIASALNTGTMTAITDEHGNYEITGLPSASYLVTIYYADISLDYPGIATHSYDTTSLDLSFDPNPPRVYDEVAYNGPPPPPPPPPPAPDDYVPTGRTFDAVIGGNADTQGDITFSGNDVFGDVNGPIDDGAMKIETTYIKEIPVGRTFEGVLGAAAGAQDDAVTFTGVESMENSYVVDGVQVGGM